VTEPLTVHIVPHTHWDREWYLPFQRFRLRLVEVVDQVLALLEANPGYRFTLDGQLATVDDYLEIRPEAESRIRALVGEGRLAVGPWQILMDEFLVSGETIVRNLELGILRAQELGGAMEAGYLPDMFGHVAQMPQLLRRAGVAHAVVWRGVPAAIDHHAFHWESPDGSAVRAEYLVGGYGNAAGLADDPERFAAEVERFAAVVAPFFDGAGPLAMAGTDHMPPNPELPALVERTNRDQQRFRLRVETLAEYLSGADGGALPRWRGELRSGARANMLMGVNSARLDLKATGARAERMLQRYAEPLLALHADDWPEPFLCQAWRRVIDNSAHDSICGCSADDVCDQVLVRFAESEQIAAGLAERAAAAVARRVPRGWIAVFNPSPHACSDVVEVELPVPEAWTDVSLELPDGTRIPAQASGPCRHVLYDDELPGVRLPALLDRIHGRELFGRQINGVEVDTVARSVIFQVDEEAGPERFDATALERALQEAAEAAAEATFRVRIEATSRRRLLAAVPAPALGWSAVRVGRGTAASEHVVRCDERSLANGLVDVSVARDGTLELAGGGVALAGVGRLVDGGDAGDSYNYAPPAADRIVEEPESVSVAVRAAGPVVGRLDVVRAYRWPLALAEDASARSEEAARVLVTTAVELRVGEPFVRLRITFENPCSDHRLRFHVPLAEPAQSSFAEGQFAVVERRGAPEGGHGEVPLATYPAHGFVDAGGVALLLEHPSEYELVGERELALTILRATGLISRPDNRWREEPAGPLVAIPAAQCRRPWSACFGLYPHAGSWSDADVLAELERYRHPFLTRAGTGPAGARPQPVAGLELTARGIVLSSLRRRGDGLELRLVCEQPEPRSVLVAGEVEEAQTADLLGRPGEPLPLEPAGLRLALGPWEIRTVQLRMRTTTGTTLPGRP
jgi:mannosylglycerate hydrolase